MNESRPIQGFSRWLFDLRLKLQIFLHFLPILFAGSSGTVSSDVARRSSAAGPKERVTIRRFVLFLRRLLLFLSKLQHNKYMNLGGAARLDLYVPNFPSRAFYVGCSKFLTFDARPPCITVLISLTSACRFSCPHCYQRFDSGKDVDLEVLLRVIKRLQDSGIAFFNIEGGEPFLKYERLRRTCQSIDDRSEVWVNSTGDGITLERLQELKRSNLTAVMFSLHASDPNRLNSFMGSDQAWDNMVTGVELCHQAGVLVAFNSCLGPEAFRNGEFNRIMDRARAFGACLIQLIKPKPAGAWLNSGAPKSNGDDLVMMAAQVDRYNHHPAYKDYPAIVAQILDEHASRFGCTAGGTDRFYINAKGDVQPCEFLNVSFGNIMDEPFDAIYCRMREAFDPPGEDWLCETCASLIRDLAAQEARVVLPLPKERTAKLFAKLNRGRPTKVYSDIQNLS